MKRKYIIISVVLVVIFVPLYFFFMQQENAGAPLHYSLEATPTGSSSVSQTPGNKSNTNNTQPVDAQSTPEQVTKALYMQYLDGGNAVFANGKYKTNAYLSDSFKEDIASLYDNGNRQIFCAQNKKESVIVGQRTDVYNKDYGYLAQLFITENVPNGQNLYRVLVQNVGGKWYVFDINCVRK